MNESRQYYAKCNKLDKDKYYMFSLVESKINTQNKGTKEYNRHREQTSSYQPGEKRRSGEEQDRNIRLGCTNYYV